MSSGEIVAVIVAAFFVIGIVVGVIAVIAMSAIRDDRDRARSLPDGVSGWQEPPGAEEDDSYPRWPDGISG